MRTASLGGLAGLLVAVALVIAGLGAALPSIPSFEYTARYELDQSTGEVSFTQEGRAAPVIECSSGWEVISSTLTGSPNIQDRVVEYSIDYLRGQITIVDQAEGSQGSHLVQCQGHRIDTTPEPGYLETADHFRTGPQCEGEADGGRVEQALITPSFSTTFQVPGSEDGYCFQARGASAASPTDVPFTGQVRLVATDTTGQEIPLSTCHMVAGKCWQPAGNSGFKVNFGSVPDPQTWTLTCEADSLFGLNVPTAGTYACQGWFE